MVVLISETGSTHWVASADTLFLYIEFNEVKLLYKLLGNFSDYWMHSSHSFQSLLLKSMLRTWKWGIFSLGLNEKLSSSISEVGTSIVDQHLLLKFTISDQDSEILAFTFIVMMKKEIKTLKQGGKLGNMNMTSKEETKVCLGSNHFMQTLIGEL